MRISLGIGVSWYGVLYETWYWDGISPLWNGLGTLDILFLWEQVTSFIPLVCNTNLLLGISDSFSFVNTALTELVYSCFFVHDAYACIRSK